MILGLRMGPDAPRFLSEKEFRKPGLISLPHNFNKLHMKLPSCPCYQWCYSIFVVKITQKNTSYTKPSVINPKNDVFWQFPCQGFVESNKVPPDFPLLQTEPPK